MLKKSLLFAVLGLAAVFTVMTPSQAHAGVVVGIGVGSVIARPYVVVHPYPYAYYGPPRPYIYAPAYAYRRPGYWAGGRWYPRYYAYRGHVGPRRYWRR
jgi:hypothetical protein